MFKLVRVLENVQLKGSKGWINEGVKKEGDYFQQCIIKKRTTQYKTSSKEICLLKTYI